MRTARLGDWWRRCDNVPALPATALLRDGPLLVIAPHPDDESLGCGGVIAAAAACAIPVCIVAVTDGAASHPASGSHPAPRLAALRRAELRRAAGRLGLPVRSIRFLDLPDGRAPAQGPAFELALRQVRRIAAAHRTGVILAPWREDPHCDHKAAASLAGRLAAVSGRRRYSYPLWARLRPPEEAVRVSGLAPVRVRIGPWLGRKRAAIAAHRSQHGRVIVDDDTGFVLPAAMLRLCQGPEELYLRHEPGHDAG